MKTRTKSIRAQRIHVGDCAVDSGQLMIVDPCYLHDWVAGEYGGDSHYAECCKVTCKIGAGQIFNGLAVVSATAIGDGLYPVYITMQDGLPIKMEVCFDEGPTGELVKYLQQEKKGGAN